MADPIKKKRRFLHPPPHLLCEMARISEEENSTDVLGSYTGTGADGEPPVQDADDL